jgi:cytochrome c biogenesis protein CcmG/thiol:disulfide interchange protein DsbE
LSEATRLAGAASRPSVRKRNLILLASALPVAGIFALLGWVLAGSGGTPGGFGINSRFGEVAIQQRPAPGFVKESLEGRRVSLAELKGKVVMLDFWSSWCPPCRKEAPTLAGVYAEYRDRGVEFVGVAIWDDPGDVGRYVRELGLTYPNVLDEKGQIAIDYGVAGIPEKFFIDAQGSLVRSFVGPVEANDLRGVLDGMLAAPPGVRLEAEGSDVGR